MTQAPHKGLQKHYEKIVAAAHGDDVIAVWPIVSGANARIAEFGDWQIWHLVHTGIPYTVSWTGIGKLKKRLLYDNSGNKDSVRRNIERYFRIKREDMVLIQDRDGLVEARDFLATLNRHAEIIGMSAEKIFLSHKGADKTMVREYDLTLKALGFETWLDEDAMKAGDRLRKRSLSRLQGFLRGRFLCCKKL